MEALVKLHSIGVIPCVNGYASYSSYDANFTASGQHTLLALPLEPTMEEYGVKSIESVGLCVKPYTNGTTFYGKAYSFPLNGGQWQEAAPAFETSEAVLVGNENIQVYRTNTEKVSSYSTMTIYTLVCVNNSENILWVYPESVSVDGVKTMAYSLGTVPPFSTGTTSLAFFEDIPDGTEVTIQFRIMDVRANFRNIISEKITFAS